MVRVRLVTPLPEHSGHGSSILDPVPPQSVQGSANPVSYTHLTLPTILLV